jgi:methylmalonyl-CoA mutase N-terminal domain/subunit
MQKKFWKNNKEYKEETMAKHPKLAEWEENELAKSLSRFPERKEKFTNHGGEEIPRLEAPENIDDQYIDKLAFPGQYPFTRGVQPTMYRGRLWTMRQYAGFSTAAESNKRYRYLLEQGTTGLSVAFDLPTQIGYDSDDPMSLGEVGKVGVAIDSLADMETLFDQIPLGKVSTSMTINSPAAILLAMYVAVGEKQGVAPENIKGTIQNDVLKEYVARGTYIFPPKPSLRLITNIFQWCGQNTPAFNTISISGYHIREAGSTAVQEIAFTLANGCTYVQTALDAGLELEVFARRLAFFFNASSDLLEEVAKFRAARRLWARLMKERFGAKKQASLMLRFHTQTAGNTLTAQQIDNNIVRVTIQALAAVLGGTQSLHTNSKDEAHSLPTEEAVQTALRTQQVLAHESGVADTIDPLAGSYYIEALTDKIESDALALINKIEESGGVVKCIEDGFIKRQIENAAYQYQLEIERGDRIIVGMNKFQVHEERKPPLLRVNPAVEKTQIDKLAEVKNNRNNKQVEGLLARLGTAAQGSENLMPHIYSCVKEYATIGEICNVLRKVFGEYKDRG